MKEKINFQNSKRQKLVGVLYSPDTKGKFPAIIFCHGFGSNKESNKATTLSKKLKNVIFLVFDFYGHGESDGKFEDVTLTEEIDDLKKAIDFIYNFENFDKENLTVIGSSFAGMVSLIQTANDDRIKKLVLIAPALLSSERYAKINKEKNREMKKLFYEDLNRYNGFKSAERVKCKTLIIHGTKDEAVPIEISKKLVKIISSAKLEIIQQANHKFTNLSHFNKMINLILDFVRGKK